ncbi:MAG: substrate-binding domain-containing protein [Bacteroidia bacterium]
MSPVKKPHFLRGTENNSTGSIYIVVDQTLRPVIEAEINTFEAIYPDARITALYMPGEEAIQALLASDSIRMAIATRRLRADEEAMLGAQDVRPKYAPIGKDGIVLVTHPDNPTRTLTLAQLRDILTGRVQRWDQLEGSSKQGNIVLVFDHARSSTMQFLQDSFLTGEPLRREGVYAQQSTPDMMRYVADHPQALGVGGFAWVSDRDDPLAQELLAGVRIVGVERPDSAHACAYDERFFGPYQSYLYQRCYPFTRTMNTILRETFFGLGTGFVAYLDGPQGQRIIHKTGLTAIHGIPRVVRLPAKPGATPIR